MRFDCILAFGDSTVAGTELDNDVFYEAKHKSFPAILGQRLGIPVHNFAWPGGSNDRSFRLLPEKLLQHPNSLVIFFYTEWSRNEYFRPDLPDYLPSDDTGYSPLGLSWLHESVSPTTKDLVTTYYKNFYHDTQEYNNYRQYNMMLMVQMLCQKYAKDFIHVFGFPACLTDKVDKQKIILDQIDRSKILKFPGETWSTDGWNLSYGNLIEWVEKNKFPIGLSHMLLLSHEKLADLIESHLYK